MRTLALMLLASGCGDPLEGSTSTTGDTGSLTPTPTLTDTGTGTTPTGCDVLTSGSGWAWDGECPGMITPFDLEQSGCSLSVAYMGGMSMGMPESALITGNTVTFEDGPAVTNCVGTVESADRVTGSCDGCTFTFSRGT